MVNQNYRDFLSLGSALQGGDEKVEEVRVGLLSFKRDVQAIRENVDTRRKEIEQSLKEKKRLREDANVGKSLLDFADRVEELERRLMIQQQSNQNIVSKGGGGGSDRSTEEDDDTEDSDLSGTDTDDSEDYGTGLTGSGGSAAASVVSLKKLEYHIQKYLYLTTLAARIGNEHPFLLNQRARIVKIRSTLALDLKTALEQTKHAGEKRDVKALTVLRLYNLLGEDISTVSQMKNLRL